MPIAGIAVMRAADAMLWALGGDQIFLVLPLATAPTDPGSQLGLSDPGVQQVSLSPVVIRNLSGLLAERGSPGPKSGPRLRLEMLLSASAVNSAVEAQALGSADALFNSALGIQYRADLFHIESVNTDYFAGVAYLYRIVAVE